MCARSIVLRPFPLPAPEATEICIISFEKKKVAAAASSLRSYRNLSPRSSCHNPKFPSSFSFPSCSLPPPRAGGRENREKRPPVSPKISRIPGIHHQSLLLLLNIPPLPPSSTSNRSDGLNISSLPLFFSLPALKKGGGETLKKRERNAEKRSPQ